MSIKDRLQKLRLSLAEREIEAILISQPENRCYLSGFDGSSGFLLITPQKAILVTDFRYMEQARKQAPEYEILQRTGDITDWFPRVVTELRLKRLGFEAEHITFALYHQFSNAMEEMEYQLGLVPLNRLVESIRVIKEPEEIELITRAVEMADNAIEHIEDRIHTGMTEKGVAWEIERFLREQGSQALPFDIIVASGPNSALPHAKPSSRPISSGEPVVVDIEGPLCQGEHILREPDVHDETALAILRGAQSLHVRSLESVPRASDPNSGDSLLRDHFLKSISDGKQHARALGRREEARLAYHYGIRVSEYPLPVKRFLGIAVET